MIRSLFLHPDGNLQTDLTVAEFRPALEQSEAVLWVDFENTPVEEDEPLLRQVFGFHPLAIDDALQETHVPKLDNWGDYLYIVLSALHYMKGKEDQIEIYELDIFLGENFIVTHHDQPLDAVEKVRSLFSRNHHGMKSGPDHVLYLLADEVVAAFMNVVEGLDEDIDEVEVELFENPEPETLERIFSLKRAVLQLRRVVAHQREVLNRLARDDYPIIDNPDRVYFRDVYDHLVRLYDITENLRDLVSGVLDTYLSVINNRMNDIMKTLTLITTLFMPISFVASFFGMNFFAPVANLEGWTSHGAFLFTLALMLVLPAGMYWYMTRRRWL